MRFPVDIALVLLPLINTVFTLPQLPVCVIGAGPSGITVGRQLKAKNINYRIFEAESRVGGKAFTWRDSIGNGVEMGAFFFTKYEYYINKAVKDAGLTTKWFNGSRIEIYNQSYNSLPLPESTDAQKAMFVDAVNRYTALRDTYDLTVGYVNAPVEAQVSLAQWLRNNNLQVLSALFIPYVTVQGYGSLEEIPAIYIIKMLNIKGLTSLQDFAHVLHTVPQGLDALWGNLSKGLNVHLNHDVTRIFRFQSRQGKTMAQLHFKNKQQPPVLCSHIIVAFPPTPDKIKPMFTDLCPDEEELIFKFRNNYYGTSVIESKGNQWQNGGIFNLLSNTNKFPVEPVGKGETVAFLNQNKYYSAYSWYKGRYYGLPPQSIQDLFLDKQKELLKEIDRVSNSSSEIGFRKYFAYFPHVSTSDIQNGFFKKFDALQGKKNTFYLTTALSFETMNTAIEMSEHIFKTKILNEVKC